MKALIVHTNHQKMASIHSVIAAAQSITKTIDMVCIGPDIQVDQIQGIEDLWAYGMGAPSDTFPNYGHPGGRLSRA